MPVRAWRTTTRDATRSILEQTHTDLELIVVGHDDVTDTLNRLPPDPRLRGVAREGPGLVSALQSGLKAARGTFIARMDDDDVARPLRLESQLRHLTENSRLDLLGARVALINEHGGRSGIGAGFQRYEHWLNRLTGPDDIRDACFIECPLPHPTWFAHRDVWTTLGGYRHIDGPEDHDFVLRARNAGLAMGKPDAVLLDWREHPERLTHQDARYRREAFTAVRADAACDPSSGFGLDRGRAVWIAGTGRNGRWWHDALAERDANIAGFVDLDRPGARQQKRHRPVITYEQLWQMRTNELLVTAITNDVARAHLIDALTAHGWINGRDYLIGG